MSSDPGPCVLTQSPELRGNGIGTGARPTPHTHLWNRLSGGSGHLHAAQGLPGYNHPACHPVPEEQPQILESREVCRRLGSQERTELSTPQAFNRASGKTKEPHTLTPGMLPGHCLTPSV